MQPNRWSSRALGTRQPSQSVGMFSRNGLATPRCTRLASSDGHFRRGSALAAVPPPTPSPATPIKPPPGAHYDHQPPARGNRGVLPRPTGDLACGGSGQAEPTCALTTHL